MERGEARLYYLSLHIHLFNVVFKFRLGILIYY